MRNLEDLQLLIGWSPGATVLITANMEQYNLTVALVFRLMEQQCSVTVLFQPPGDLRDRVWPEPMSETAHTAWQIHNCNMGSFDLGSGLKTSLGACFHTLFIIIMFHQSF